MCAVILGEHMRNRILNLISAISKRSHVRNFARDKSQIEMEMDSLELQLSELMHIRDCTETSIVDLFLNVSHSYESSLERLEDIVSREILICLALSKCIPLTTQVHSKGFTLIAQGWVPSIGLEDLNQLVRVASHGSGVPGGLASEIDLPLNAKPPTLFITNEFTGAFQLVVDTYGVARYKEFNPNLFTIITFPFLFGVMYGDVGHSSILLLVSLYLIFFKDSVYMLNSLRQLVIARYMLLLMSLFGIYCGLIYNDFFALSMGVFRSQWRVSHIKIEQLGVPVLGVDPAWHGSKNELSFLNSLKMKMSIVLGVSHMLLGLSVHFINLAYERDYDGIFFEAVPQLIFLLSTFGYMVLLILIKWSSSDTNAMSQVSILQTMIEMFIPGNGEKKIEWYEGQFAFQRFLVTLSILSVPVLFMGRPLVQRIKAKIYGYERIPGSLPDPSNHLELEVLHVKSPESRDPERIDIPMEEFESEKEDPVEVLVHQLIHTVEFVLGSISNTASYLRLWALSLAHQRKISSFISPIRVVACLLGAYRSAWN